MLNLREYCLYAALPAGFPPKKKIKGKPAEMECKIRGLVGVNYHTHTPFVNPN